jgi:signal transduction histidine kinase
VGNFLRAVRPAPPELHPIQIHELLSETIRFMKTEIEDRGILVQASWPETLPRIEGDAAQLRQAFYNLIRNAVQAMPEGGLLRVVCEEKEEFVEIAFADTGHGIAPENLVRIMEPYFTTKPGGTGLGMLIVERIIRNHGGQFTIESEVDKGTVFTLRLPLHERRVRLLEAPQP